MFLPAQYEIWSHRALSQFRILELTRKLDKHWQWNNLDMIKQQILNLSTIENGLKMCEEAFKYPHKSLKDVFNLYCENLLKPLSKSVEEDYKNSLKLWKKLEAAKNDPKQWLKLLEQIEDKNVVIANMELILSLDTNWAKKGFWLKLIGISKEEKSRVKFFTGISTSKFRY
uniref:Uncharacterized protein n=1 Tax=Panagrolaimus davidi TaxID=227884 RepID=A0A914RDR0_9BILA